MEFEYLKVSQAAVALCDIRRVPEGVSVRGRRGRKVAVSFWGQLAKRAVFKVSPEDVMSFCAAGVAL